MPMPEKFGGTFQGCVNHFLGKTNPRTNKPYTKEEAGAICGAIEKKISS